MTNDADNARFVQDFLTAFRRGQAFHGLSIYEILELSGVSRATYYSLLTQLQVPRWATAVALAAATGWRMDLVITPRTHRRAPTMTAPSMRGHLPSASAVATSVLRCVPIVRQQAAVALLMGLARRGWSLRRAARAAHLSPTKPSSLLTATYGPDFPTLAQLLRPLGYTVSVRYRPWNAPDPPVLIRPTPAAAQRIRTQSMTTFAMLARLSPAVGNLVQDPDAATIRAAYAQHRSLVATAAMLQVTSVWLRAAMRRFAIPVPSYVRGSPATRRTRNRHIIREVTHGQSYRRVGQRYGITGSRVQQILCKQGIDVRKLRRERRRRSQQDKLRRREAAKS